jgi:geranylgeranyl pyrophosphate synthase
MESREFFRSISCGLDAVQRELQAQAESIVRTWSLQGRSSQHVEQVVRHLFEKPGKMLRPALVLLSAGLASSREPGEQPNLVRLATAVELLHSASLIHDDIIDEEELRRGRPALHQRFGDHTAVLVGDILYSHSFALLTELELPRWERHKEIFRLYCDTTSRMCLGEICEQQVLDQALTLSFPEYLEILVNKTAILMSACCRGAAIVSDAEPALVERLSEFGLAFGLAFQLADDAGDRDALVSRECDLLAAARKQLARARGLLGDLPDSPYRRELLSACDFILIPAGLAP